MGVCQIDHSQGSQLLLKLEKVGLTTALAQLVIEDGSSARARAMVAAAQNGIVPQIIAPPFTPTVWRQEMLGLHHTVQAFRTALERGGNRLDHYADKLLVETPLATERTTVDLFRATGRELGLTRRYTFARLLEAAARHNLGKLPAESGPALRESYSDQPKGEVVWICMDPIMGSGGLPYVWRVSRDGGGRWLSTDCVFPTDKWNPETVWVFGAVPSKR